MALPIHPPAHVEERKGGGWGTPVRPGEEVEEGHCTTLSRTHVLQVETTHDIVGTPHVLRHQTHLHTQSEHLFNFQIELLNLRFLAKQFSNFTIVIWFLSSIGETCTDTVHIRFQFRRRFVTKALCKLIEMQEINKNKSFWCYEVRNDSCR